MKIVGIIPARLESSRLPEKALIDIEGLPMILHTLKRAQLAKTLDEVYVATDSGKIRKIVEDQGGNVVMTGSHHRTGSDRVAEAASKIEADIIVNIQGDEPLLDPGHIDKVIEPLLKDSSLQVAVLVAPYKKKNSISDIKAVLDLENNVLYCSRNDIPSDARTEVKSMWKMCFIVPFRRDFLLKYASLEKTPLEEIEFNEYLRILENGFKLRAVKVDSAEISVDTNEDLWVVREAMKGDKIRTLYLK